MLVVYKINSHMWIKSISNGENYVQYIYFLQYFFSFHNSVSNLLMHLQPCRLSSAYNNLYVYEFIYINEVMLIISNKQSYRSLNYFRRQTESTGGQRESVTGLDAFRCALKRPTVIHQSDQSRKPQIIPPYCQPFPPFCISDGC